MSRSIIDVVLDFFSTPETIRRLNIFRAIESKDLSKLQDAISQIPEDEKRGFRAWRDSFIGAAIETDKPEILDLVVNQMMNGSYSAKFRDVAVSQIGSGSVVKAEYSALGWAIKSGSTSVAFHLASRDIQARMASCHRLALEKGMSALAEEIQRVRNPI